MNKRPRPTFAQIAETVRKEVEEESENWMAIERQVILENARLEYEHAYNLLSKHTTALELENAMLREQLRIAQRSWFKALVSRIKSPWA
jgi:hypothetical protein